MGALRPEASSWELPDDAATPAADEPASARAPALAGPALDTMIAQYFGEVRQFARLSGPEEYALARRIERWQRRVRWALYTTPVALPTLRTLWAQVVAQALPVDAVVQPLDAAPDLPAAHTPTPRPPDPPASPWRFRGPSSAQRPRPDQRRHIDPSQLRRHRGGNILHGWSGKFLANAVHVRVHNSLPSSPRANFHA